MNLTQSEVKYLRSLQQKKIRDTEKKFLLEGWRPLHDALNSEYQVELIALLPETRKKQELRPILDLAETKRVTIRELKESQLDQISNAVHSQGIVALIRQRSERFSAGSPGFSDCLVACDRISDPGNLGTILRTCDWFGVEEVLLGEGCVSPYNEKVVRGTAGSIFHLKIFEDVNLVETFSALKGTGFTIAATAADGKPIDSLALPNKFVLLLGNEAGGVEPNLIRNADVVWSIPRYGRAESLNVGIACGIFLKHWRDRRTSH